MNKIVFQSKTDKDRHRQAFCSCGLDLER